VQARISHSGIVETVSEGCVSVRILQTSACAACKVSGYCHAAEAKEKIVDVYGCDTAKYSTGQEVIVTASGSVAKKALILGFGIPFLLVLGVLVAVLLLTNNEGVAALSALGSLLPYYFLLWLRRDSIQRSISFQIEEKNIN
jgi:sigma-E factor negative regulatory protein RseC